MKPGEVWSYGHVDDDAPWYYLVLEADDDGVDMVLLDSAGEPDCDPGDLIALSWGDVREAGEAPGRLVWRLVG